MLWMLIRIAEGILMSTHNIGFYEDLTKIIFELSSNIIKYAPYFFFCDTKLFFLDFYFVDRIQFIYVHKSLVTTN